MKHSLLVHYRARRAPYFSDSYPGRPHFTPAAVALRQARNAIQVRIDKARFANLGGKTVPWYETKDGNADGASVRIVEHPDPCKSIEELMGYMYDPNINPDIIKRQRKEFIEQAEYDGVWGYVAQHWNGARWIDCDSRWGFLGDDFEGSGYDIDLMNSAMDAHTKHVARELEETRPDMYSWYLSKS